MKNALFVILFLALASAAQTLPETAVVLEKVNVTPSRSMVLWMDAPTKHPRIADDDEIYTCPDNTRGHYYSGVGRLSLVESSSGKLIQTLEIVGPDEGLDLPYLIRRTGYYDVPALDKNEEGKPVIMKLRDYNGDGTAYEFALFDAVACMGLETSLLGYDPKSDRVLQYEVELTADGTTDKTVWVDYLFGNKPDKTGLIKYQIDYRGRGGSLEMYRVRYDRKRGIFVGHRTSIDEPIERRKPSK